MADPERGDVSPVGGRSAPGARAIVVSGSADAAVRVWDLAAGVLLRPPLKGHDGDVNALGLNRTVYTTGLGSQVDGACVTQRPWPRAGSSRTGTHANDPARPRPAPR
jgi:flagellar basal body P-ring protein FlgI